MPPFGVNPCSALVFLKSYQPRIANQYESYWSEFIAIADQYLSLKICTVSLLTPYKTIQLQIEARNTDNGSHVGQRLTQPGLLFGEPNFSTGIVSVL